MPQPRQIYVGSLHRRERAWGRARRRRTPAGVFAMAGSVAAVCAAVLPRLGL